MRRRNWKKIEKERKKKGDWHVGWGINQELELEKCETIVEHRRRCTSRFLRNIWGDDREERVEEGRGSNQSGGWISGGFLRSTTRGVERPE